MTANQIENVEPNSEQVPTGPSGVESSTPTPAPTQQEVAQPQQMVPVMMDMGMWGQMMAGGMQFAFMPPMGGAPGGDGQAPPVFFMPPIMPQMPQMMPYPPHQMAYHPQPQRHHQQRQQRQPRAPCLPTHAASMCTNCHTTQTTLWRRSPTGEPECK